MSASRRKFLKVGGTIAAATFLPLTSAGAQTGPVRRWRFAHAGTTDTVWQLWAEQFKKGIEDKTGGKITLQIYPNAQLGNERETAQAVRIGSVEMGAIGAGLTGWVQDMAVTDAPFLWKSRKQAYNALDGALGEELRKRCLGKGFRLIGWTELGSRCMANSKRTIKAAKDVAGLKMRVPVAKAYIALMEALGASTVAIDISELYLALSQGVADGCEPPVSVVKATKLHEVQKYIAKTDHILTTAYTVINPKSYDALTADEQKAFNTSCREADVAVRQFTVKDELECFTFYKEKGLEVTMDVDVASFREVCAPVIGKFPDLFAPDLVKMAQATPE